LYNGRGFGTWNTYGHSSGLDNTTDRTSGRAGISERGSDKYGQHRSGTSAGHHDSFTYTAARSDQTTERQAVAFFDDLLNHGARRSVTYVVARCTFGGAATLRRLELQTVEPSPGLAVFCDSMYVWIYFAPEKVQMSDWADSNNGRKWVTGHHHVNGQKNNSPFGGTE
jgi:hypothetical protein